MNFKKWFFINESTSESDLVKAIEKIKGHLDPSDDAQAINRLDQGLAKLMQLKGMDVVPNSELNAAKDQFKISPHTILPRIYQHYLNPLNRGNFGGFQNKDNPIVDGKPNPFYQALGTSKFENWTKYSDALHLALYNNLSVGSDAEKIAKTLKKYAANANDYPFVHQLDKEQYNDLAKIDAPVNIPLKSGREIVLADWMEDAGKLWKTLSDFIKENIQPKAKKDADIRKEEKEKVKQEKDQAKKAEIERARAAIPAASFEADEKMQNQIRELLQEKKEEYISDFLSVAHDQVDEFIKLMPQPPSSRLYGSEAQKTYKEEKRIRELLPIASRIVKEEPDGLYIQPSEAAFQKAANESWENVSDTFFHRITHKLTPIVMAKAAKTGQPANIEIISVTTRYGILEVKLRVKFSDNSSFDVNHQMVSAISGARRGAMYSTGGGKRFYRFPTTFHNVIMPNGEKMQSPSVLSVYTDFAGVKPPEAIKSDEEAEVQD